MHKKSNEKKLLFNIVFLSLLFCFTCKRQNQVIQLKEFLEKTINNPAHYIVQADTIHTSNAPSKITRKIRKDKEGNLLFAAYEDIIQYDGGSFRNISKIKGIDSFDAFDVIQDTKGNIWIASTHFGVFKFDGKTYSNFTTKDGLAHDRTMCIHEDRNGKIWIGTQEGISIYDGKTFQNITTKNGLTNNDINTIMEDRTGKIWVGTRGTLCVYAPITSVKKEIITFKEFLSEEGKTFENIWAIVEDRNRTLWLGGQYGLWQINKASSKQMTPKSTTGVYEDTKGNIWLTHITDASHKAGLSRLYTDLTLTVSSKLIQVFEGDGMFFGISEDQAGGIWVGTLNSVFRYDGKAINYFKNTNQKGD